MGISRREFLATVLSGAGVATLPACSGAPPPSVESAPPDSGSDGTAARRALLAMREAIRESPDHLPRRAADAVATKDAAAILRFVATQLQVRPARGDALEEPTTRGLAAVLRSGYGTPREVNEVLAQLLADAGFAPELVMIRHDRRDAAFTERVATRVTAPAFAPAWTAAQLQGWKRDLKLPDEPPPVAALGAHVAACEALADRILGALPEDAASPHRFPPWGKQTPAVRVTVDGVTKLAVAFDEKATLRPDEETSPLEPLPPQEVRLTLEGTAAGAAPRVLVEARFPAARLLGRHVSFSHPAAGRAGARPVDPLARRPGAHPRDRDPHPAGGRSRP